MTHVSPGPSRRYTVSQGTVGIVEVTRKPHLEEFTGKYFGVLAVRRQNRLHPNPELRLGDKAREF